MTHPDQGNLRTRGVENVEKVLLMKTHTTQYPTAYAAYIAAAIYPQNFDLTKMVNILVDRFPEVRRMHPKGRQNVVTKLEQTKPPLDIPCLLWEVQVDRRDKR